MAMTQREWADERVHAESPRLTVITLSKGNQSVRKKDYNYIDMVRPLEDGSLEVLYQGTEKGREDKHLLDAIDNSHPFKVYYRVKRFSFKELGIATDVTIHTPRSDGQRLVIRLVIRNVVNRLVPQYSDGFEFARYKRDVMIHAGVLGREGNQQLLMKNNSLFNGFWSTV
jgi:hypothetical protein